MYNIPIMKSCKFIAGDPVVPYKFGQLSSGFLKGFMKNASFTTYRGMSHCSSDEELADMKVFVQQHATGM